MGAGVGIRPSDVAALAACVSLADIANDHIRDHPDGEMAQGFRKAVLEAGADPDAQLAMLPELIADAEVLTATMIAIVELAETVGAMAPPPKGPTS